VTVRRLLGAALMVSVLLGGLVVVTAGPAVACTCAMVRSEAERMARADAVFVGELVGSRVDPSASSRETRRIPYPAPVVLTFKVSRVYKGAVGERQEIIAPLGPCPLPLSGAGPFLVFANNPSQDMSRQYQLEPGQYVSGLGSRALADGGKPALGPPAGEPGWPDSLVGVGVLVAGVAAGLGLAALRARLRASAE
jgi:hypothetical protein